MWKKTLLIYISKQLQKEESVLGKRYFYKSLNNNSNALTSKFWKKTVLARVALPIHERSRQESVRVIPVQIGKRFWLTEHARIVNLTPDPVRMEKNARVTSVKKMKFCFQMEAVNLVNRTQNQWKTTRFVGKTVVLAMKGFWIPVAVKNAWPRPRCLQMERIASQSNVSLLKSLTRIPTSVRSATHSQNHNPMGKLVSKTIVHQPKKLSRAAAVRTAPFTNEHKEMEKPVPKINVLPNKNIISKMANARNARLTTCLTKLPENVNPSNALTSRKL